MYPASVATAQSDPLSLRAWIILVITGTALWAIGVALLRWLAAMDWLTGTAHIIVYALTVVGTVPLIPIGRIAAGLPPSETARSVTVVSLTALLIDGVVIGYFPWIYSADEATARLCAGALLWGVGIALALGLIMQPHQR